VEIEKERAQVERQLKIKLACKKHTEIALGERNFDGASYKMMYKHTNIYNVFIGDSYGHGLVYSGSYSLH